MGGVQGRVQSLVCRLVTPAGGAWRPIAVNICCDWLQQLPHEYSNMSC